MAITLKTPEDVQLDVALRFKARRLALNLSQEGLAKRSGVTWGSLKRFERTGLISLRSLLKIALVLGYLDHFNSVGSADVQSFSTKSLDDILAETKTRKKGRKK